MDKIGLAYVNVTRSKLHTKFITSDAMGISGTGKVIPHETYR
jgi:hypothetical protein